MAGPSLLTCFLAPIACESVSSSMILYYQGETSNDNGCGPASKRKLVLLAPVVPSRQSSPQ